jgi:hypothetical protein
VNWFENNPTKSVITYTLFIAGAVWATSTFVLDENKINTYKVEIENANIITEQYKSKIDILETEISRLKDENQKYLNWLENSPNTIPFMEKKMKTLQDENSNLMSKIPVNTNNNPNTDKSNEQLYSKTVGDIKKGEAYADPYTGATIGVLDVNYNFEANLNLILPGKKTETINNVKTGTVWEYEQFDLKFKIMVSKINWHNNSIEVKVVQVK